MNWNRKSDRRGKLGVAGATPRTRQESRRRALQEALFESLESRQLLTTFTVTNLSNSGAGSLRQAILDSNNAAGADTIAFQAGLSGTMFFNSSAMSISGDLSIEGPADKGFVVNPSGVSPAFVIQAGATVAISNLFITNGHAATDGGGIHNSGALTLTGCTIANCSAGRDGGGVYSQGTLVVRGSSLANNTSGGAGGGAYAQGTLTLESAQFSSNVAIVGGGVDAHGTSTISGSFFLGNTITVGRGGGVSNSGPMTISGTMFSGNQANSDGQGGGLYNAGTLTLTTSTFTSNHAGGSGSSGGGLSNTGTFSLSTSTFSSNTAPLGAGIMLQSGTGSIIACTISGNNASATGGGLVSITTTLSIINSTLANNSAPSGGALAIDGGTTILNSTIAASVAGAGIFITSGAPHMVSTIVSANIGGDIVNGTLDSGSGYNLVKDASHAGGLSNGVNNNIVGQDPGIGGLAANGGPTLTMAVLSSSSAACRRGSNPAGLTNDQRGGVFLRGPYPDIGAFQRQSLNLVVDDPAYLSDGDYSPGHLTLFEAILLSNASAPGSTITFANSLKGQTLSMSGSTAFGIRTDVTITGPGASQLTLNANNASRVFIIDPGITASISGLALTGGRAANGAGIWNFGTLSIADLDIHGNVATGVGGGGIDCASGSGPLTVLNSTISNNSGALGGGIFYESTDAVTITNSTISGNTSSFGGGINFSYGGTLTVAGSTISANTAQRGAGIYASIGAVSITNSCISGNSTDATGYGAGVCCGGAPLIVSNSTISGNVAGNGGGGGIWSLGSTVAIANCTIAGNSATAAAGGIKETSGSISLVSSIVAGNTGGDLAGDPLAAGSVHNLIQDPSSAGGLINGVNGNIVGANPLLGALASNGGRTQTRSLPPGSPALAGGSNPLNLTTDQRGGLFVRGTLADIGAYQHQSFALIVDTLSDADDGNVTPGNLSLREAIAAAGPNPGNDTITFAPALSGGAITLASGSELAIYGDLTIAGPGAAQLIISAAGHSRVFSLRPGSSVVMSGLLVVDGLSDYGGGIYVGGGSHLTMVGVEVSYNVASQSGGGVYVDGYLNASACRFRGNHATVAGGGIYIMGGVGDIADSDILENKSTASGAGVTVYGATATLNRVKITGNTATGFGGAIQVDGGSITVQYCSVLNNYALNLDGGGIHGSMSEINVTQSALFSNHAGRDGGGMFLDQCVSKIFSSTVAGNIVQGLGGGVRAVNGSLAIANATLVGSTAPGPAGELSFSGASVTMISTIVSGNTGADIQGGTLAPGSTCNLIENPVFAGGLVNGVAGNIVGVDPEFDGSTSDNGGITKAIGLLPGSPAIGKGTNPYNFVTDQRGDGFARVHGWGIDIGALEFNAAPVIASLSANSASVVRNQAFVLIASVTDADGPIARVDFYRDANNNGAVDAGEFIGSDSDPAGGYRFSVAPGLPLGQAQFLAIALDTEAQASPVTAGTVTIINAVPTPGVLTSDHPTLKRGGTLALTATASDADGTITRIDFYRDANADGIAEPGELIGSDANGADGFGVVFNSPFEGALGNVQFLALAVDNEGGVSAAMAASVTFTNAAPAPGVLGGSSATFAQGDAFTLTATGFADPDGVVTSVSFYADTNNNGVADSGELLGADNNSADGFALALSIAQSNALPVGTVAFLAIATDNDGATSPVATAAATAAFSIRAGTDRLVSGTADNADASRVVTVNPNGHVIVFEAGWTAADLQAKTGAPIATGDAAVWLDPKDGLVYVAAPSADGLLLFTRAAGGTWSLRNLTAETGAAVSPTHGLTQITSMGNIILVAGISDDGKIVAFQQTVANAGAPTFKFVNISADLGSQGMNTPELTSLTGYVTTWDAWNLAGIDNNGKLQVVWVVPATFTTWRADDLSAITGAPAAQGQLAVTLTSWGGINLAGLGANGHLLTTWWVPSFGGVWQVNDLTDQFNGAPLSGGKVSGYTTPWGGLNYVGLANDGAVMVYWWAPGLTDWSVSPLLPDSIPVSQRPAGTLTSSSSAAGTLNVYGVSATGNALRMWWKPSGAGAWAVDDVSAIAGRT